jgi:hypothetical protein
LCYGSLQTIDIDSDPEKSVPAIASKESVNNEHLDPNISTVTS